MNPEELRDTAYYARRYIHELAWNSHDYVAERQYALICCDYVLDTVKEDDDDRLTEKSVVGHPMFQKITSYGNWGECKQHFVLGDFEVVWEGPDEFGIKWDNELLFPQPRTWGELRYLAKMLNAKLDSA